MREIIRECSDYRVLKFDIARRELADVVAELQARSCSIEGTEAELKEHLLRKSLIRIPALARRVPWYAVDEARAEDRMLIQLAQPEQTGAAAAPASAATQAPVPPAAVQAGAHSSSPSSDAMRGLDRGLRESAAVHQDAAYEDVYADEDGLRILIDDMNDNANSNVRVRIVNDLFLKNIFD